jgi:hypothetical protein
MLTRPALDSGDATMTLRTFPGLAFRRAVSPAFLACAAVAACSSTPPPPPDTFIHAWLTAHKDTTGRADALCSFGSAKDVLNIGAPTGNSPMTQANGTAGATGNVFVDCTVTGGFQVNLTGALAGSGGATLQILGHVDVSSGGTGISTTFTSGTFGNYGQSDCTIAYTYGSPPRMVPTSPPVAAGRIWAHLACPSALTMSNHMRMLPDGSFAPEICDFEADFEFENCAQ